MFNEILKPVFVPNKVTYDEELKDWIFYYPGGNWPLSTVISKYGNLALFKKKIKFKDEQVWIGESIWFIPKKIDELLHEGWSKDETGKIRKKPYFMGKKKQNLLGRALIGSVTLNANMKPVIRFNDYFFTEDMVKFVLPENVVPPNEVNAISDGSSTFLSIFERINQLIETYVK